MRDEETRISLFLQLNILEAILTYLLIVFIPCFPVWALALPEFTIKTLQNPLLFCLSHIIGADGVEVFE